MKAFSRKRASLLVTATLAIALFVGACGSDPAPAETAPPAQQEQQQNDPPPPPPAQEDDGEEAPAVEPAATVGNILHDPVDLGGRTITAFGWWEGVLPFSAQNYDEPDPATSDNYFVDRLIFDNAQRVREQFNFNIEEVVIDYGYLLETLTTTVMAGDSLGDIGIMSGGWMLPAIMGDLIMPLDSIDLPGSDLLNDGPYTNILVEAFGERWSFWDSRPEVNGFTVGINLDIINAIGATNPVDLYNSGQWTWDAFLEIMRLATNDTTGDGVIDRFGIAGQPGDLAFYLIGANDGRMVDDDLNYALDHPNTLEALEFLQTIFAENLWEYDQVAGIDTGDWAGNFFRFQNGNAAFFPAVTWAMNDGDLPFEFAVVPWPTGPSNTSGNTWMGGWPQGITFPHGSDWNPAEILMVVEEFMTWAGDDIDLMHEDSYSWARGVFLTEEDVQRQSSAPHTMAQDIGMSVPQYSWVFGSFVVAFADQTYTVQQLVEMHRGPQQELLDNFFR